MQGDDPADLTPGTAGGRRGKNARVLSLGELPGILVVALLVSIVIRLLIVQAYYIPTSSMLPTLEIDDRILVSKLSYQLLDPEQGDLVVFDSPLFIDQPPALLWERTVRNVLEAIGIRTPGMTDLIKRVIAVGGDRLEIRGNLVWVNGEPLDEPYLAPGYQMQELEPFYIPAGHIWVMGDNRNDSQDSRLFGPIPVEDVTGRTIARIWPIGRWDRF